MITTFLVEHPWITTVAFLAIVAVGPIAGYWLVVRRRLAMWLGLATLLPVAALTLNPGSQDFTMGCATEWALPTFSAVEPMANVVLFVPPVLMLVLALRRPVAVCLGASAVSALIEVTQALVPALDRSCSTNDWLTNTLGSTLGALIAVLAIWLRSRSTAAPL